MPRTSDLENGRFVLLLDILGFKNLVKNRPATEIYAMVTKALRVFDVVPAAVNLLTPIYFSDTLLFYQEGIGYDQAGFGQAVGIAAFLQNTLLSERIPIRGALSFAEFTVTDDQRIYFGKALIEAYEAEKTENWIGVTVCRSAWGPFKKPRLESMLRQGHCKRREDGTLVVSPFRALTLAFHAHTGNRQPDRQLPPNAVPGELGAFWFVYNTAKQYAAQSDFSGQVAVKYHTTLAFFREVLGDECFEWAALEAQKLQVREQR